MAACQPLFVDAPIGEEVAVTSITDGDTFEVTRSSGETEVVRLAGINAPERGECHFAEATDYLADQTLGRDIVLEKVGIDRFGRSLAYVSRGDIDLNESLVAHGHAIALTPDEETSDSTRLLHAEREAAESDLGLWADDACGAEGPIPPARITSFEVDPEGPDGDILDEEFVVVSNEGGSELDIGDWTLRDESSLHRHRFPIGTLIPIGGSVVVTSASPSWDPGGGPVWNNQGDLILLMDRSGRVVDAVRY